MKIYNYTAYGLNIASETYCPELKKGECEADLHIRYGSLMDIPITADRKWGSHVLDEERILINIENTARYLVSGGKEIIIDEYENGSEDATRLFLLGSAMGTALHQRGVLPLHGNGIMHKGECIIFLGNTGAGKSTLAAAFNRRGYPILSDDVCAVRVSTGGKVLVSPGFPQVKLWKESVASFGVAWQGLRKVHPDEDKYVLPVNELYCESPVPLKKIFILHFTEDGDFNFQELDPIDSIRVLRNNTYRPHIMKKAGKNAPHFKMYGEIAGQATVTRAFRPKDLSRLDEFVDIVEERFLL